jgi:ribosomal protein S18 acetylase RimI-like enzyme
MPQVQIRPAVATDVNALMGIDHSCTSDYVWQMDLQSGDGYAGAIFREIRLPRSVTVQYPRPVSALSEDWSRRSGALVATIGKDVVGYVRMTDKLLPRVAWVTDLVVAPRHRHQGVGSTLLLAAQSWALDRKNRQVVLEMLSKNSAAIRLAQKLGYEFCGYNDHYYETQDIAIFFGRTLS